MNSSSIVPSEQSEKMSAHNSERQKPRRHQHHRQFISSSSTSPRKTFLTTRTTASTSTRTTTTTTTTSTTAKTGSNMMISLRKMRSSPPRMDKAADWAGIEPKKSTSFQRSSTPPVDTTGTVPQEFLDQLKKQEETIARLMATHVSDQRAIKELRQEVETISAQNEKALGHEETIMALQTQRACDQQIMQSMRDELDALRLEQEKGKEWQRITVEQALREADAAKEQLASMEDNVLRLDLSHYLKLVEEDAPDDDMLDMAYVSRLQSHLCRSLRKMQIQYVQITDLKASQERMAEALQREIEYLLNNSKKTKANLLDQISEIEEEKKEMKRHYEQIIEQRNREILDLKGSVDFAEKEDRMQNERRHRHFLALQKQVDYNEREKHILTTEIYSKNMQISRLEMALKRKDRIISRMEHDTSSSIAKKTETTEGLRQSKNGGDNSSASFSVPVHCSNDRECDQASQTVSAPDNDDSRHSLERLNCSDDQPEQNSSFSSDNESETRHSQSSQISSDQGSVHSIHIMEDSFSFHPVDYSFITTSDNDDGDEGNDDNIEVAEDDPVEDANTHEEQEEALPRNQQEQVITSSNKKAGVLVDSFTSVLDYTKKNSRRMLRSHKNTVPRSDCIL